MICARYRDMPMLVTNILSVAMFVTPILYKPETLGDNGQWVAQYNILFHYVEIVRKPMLGEYPSLLNWTITSITAIILALIVFYFFAKKRRSIIFWL
jgi:ABC-type polysaccharide/polyol phosphate export permease